MTEQNPEPTEDAPEPTGSGRFALYNETLEQYVSPVVDNRRDLADARKAQPKDHTLSVREV